MSRLIEPDPVQPLGAHLAEEKFRLECSAANGLYTPNNLFYLFIVTKSSMYTTWRSKYNRITEIILAVPLQAFPVRNLCNRDTISLVRGWGCAENRDCEARRGSEERRATKIAADKQEVFFQHFADIAVVVVHFGRKRQERSFFPSQSRRPVVAKCCSDAMDFLEYSDIASEVRGNMVRHSVR